MSRLNSKNPPLTRAQIIGLVGDVDDATVMSIAGTGASYVDVEEAARWASGEAMTELEPAPLAGPARAVYDLLLTLPSFAPREDR